MRKNGVFRVAAVILSVVLVAIPFAQPFAVGATENRTVFQETTGESRETGESVETKESSETGESGESKESSETGESGESKETDKIEIPEGVVAIEEREYEIINYGEQFVHLKDSEIEKTCLIIGSYVINLKGLSDEAYEQAIESANSFNQMNRYYKSELAGGKWFDVTTATSIADISTDGTPVDNSVIESLKITHKVDETGIIKDLRSGFELSPFDIKSPYVLQELEELEPINNQFDILKKKEGKTNSDKAAIYYLEQLYEKTIRNDTTDKYDDIITGLELYKSKFEERGIPDTWTEEVNKVITHTDALRRVEAFKILEEYLDELLNQISGQQKVEYLYGYFPEFLDEYEYVMDENGCWKKEVKKRPWYMPVEEYYVNSDLVEAIGQAKSKVEESVSSYSSVILTEGGTATSFARYQYTNDLMNSVKITTSVYQVERKKFRIPWNHNWYHFWYWERLLNCYTDPSVMSAYETETLNRYAEVLGETVTEEQVVKNIDYDQDSCDTATRKLVDMGNITSGAIVDVESEAATAKEISDKAYLDYKGKLAEGVSEEYQKALVENAEMVVKQKCLADQKTSTNTARLEYQNILSAYFERMSSKSKLQVIEKLLNEIPDLEALVPDDAVKNYQLETVADHEEWLRQEFAKALAESGDTSEMDELNSQMDDLELQRQKALDNNDLAGEKKIAADMAAKQKDIDDLTKKYNDIIASENSSPSDKARALAGLGEGNAASMINSLLSDITAGIRNGNDGTGGSGTGGNGSGTGGSGTGGSGTGGSGAGGNGDLLNKMAAIGALGQLDPDAASQALYDIDDALKNASSLDDSMKDSLESALSDAEQMVSEASGTNLSNISSSALLELLEGILGTSLEEASSLELASAVLALSRFGYDYKNKNARNLAISYAGDMYQRQDKYIYLKLADDTREFVSTKAIGDVQGYRYVFDDIHHCVTLSRGRTYNTFTQGSLDYSYTGEKTASLRAVAAFQTTIYILSADAKKLFDVTAGYIHGCNYAIVVTPEVETKTREIYNQMVEQLR